MTNIIVKFLSSLITSITMIWGVGILSKKNIKIRDRKVALNIIIYAVYLILIYSITDSFIRVILNFVILIILEKRLINESLLKVTIYCFVIAVLMMISEMIFVGSMLEIFELTLEECHMIFLGQIFANIGISIISFLLITCIKYIKGINRLMDDFVIKNNKLLLLLILLVIFTLILLLYSTYFKVSVKTVLFINVLLVFSYSVLTISALVQTNNNQKLRENYDIILNDITDYEKILKTLRKKNHDNKNDLIVIQGLSKGNKEVEEYIKEILGEYESGSENILMKIKSITDGGLQGIVHKKFVKMEEEKIQTFIHCDEKVKELNKMTTKQKRDVSTIVGIFLDNAIESSKQIKNGKVSMLMYKEKEKIVIKITNNYQGIIELNEIEKEGYSTKGTNRGFGLSIVKEIVFKSDYLENEKEILGNLFSQILKIKM